MLNYFEIKHVFFEKEIEKEVNTRAILLSAQRIYN